MILIRGGYVIDPAQKRQGLADVVIDGEEIREVRYYPEGQDAGNVADGADKEGAWKAADGAAGATAGETADGAVEGNAWKAADGAAGAAAQEAADGAVGGEAGAADGLYERVIDASGLVVAPGLVDIHVHFRDPGQTHKEDIQSGAKAAAKGGFTTVVCMANTQPPVDNVDTLEYVIREGKKTGIHVLSTAAVTKGLLGKELTDMEELKAHGAVGFTDDGLPIMDERLLEEAMKLAAKLEVPISFHEEDKAFIKENGIHHGTVSEELGIYGSPALAEDCLVARDCMIALQTGAAVNIQHISSANAVHLVRLAKDLGARVTAEVTPHHFTLTEDAVLTYGTLAKMNPPLRTVKDREALIGGLKDGSIDVIATDHAPHSAEEKAKPLIEAPSGIIGLETALGLAVTHLVRPGHLTMMELMERMSLNPSRLYHLDCRLDAQAPADLVLFDPQEVWRVDGFISKSSNSPFVGAHLYGRVKYTICGGQVVYQDEEGCRREDA